MDASYITQPKRTAQGIFIRGTEPTKHYLREELIVLARDEMKLEVLDVLKMEYDWKTEMEDETSPIGWASRIHGIGSWSRKNPKIKKPL